MDDKVKIAVLRDRLEREREAHNNTMEHWLEERRVRTDMVREAYQQARTNSAKVMMHAARIACLVDSDPANDEEVTVRASSLYMLKHAIEDDKKGPIV